MDLKTIPETLFVRKINIEKSRWRPEDSTFSIFFNFKNKRLLVKDYRQMMKNTFLEKSLLKEEEIVNLPVSGFVVVWPDKVRDPRGFSATVSNLREIVSSSVINRGVIEGDLWYAINPENRLALVSSETEKDLKGAVSSISELKVGDIVEECYGRGTGIYLGKIKVREMDWDKHYRSEVIKLTTRRVVYHTNSDSFDTFGFGLGAGTIVAGSADPDTVFEITERFKSRLEAYTCLEDGIDSIFTPYGSEKEYPPEMLDILLSANDDEYSSIRYPFYKIAGSRKILCLDLSPCGSYSGDRIKDGVYFQLHEKDLTDFGTFAINYKNSKEEEERIKKYPGSWEELLREQGWIYFGSNDSNCCWKNNPDLMVKMKSGKTLTV